MKGLSATVLYGEAGRNGVILITTKNGAGSRSNKKFEITLDQSVFTNKIASLPDDQDAYGNGFHNTASAAFSNWGAPFDQPGKYGVAADGTIPHPYDRSSLNDALPQYIDARYPYKAYDNLQNFFETGLISNTSLNVASRVGEGTSLNFSYAYRNEDGFVPLSSFEKHNFGFGTNTKLENGLQVSTTFNYVNSNRVAPPTATSTSSNPNGYVGEPGASLFSNVFYVPRSVDLNGLEWENPVDNSSIYYRSGNDIQNPYWTLNNTSDSEKINRYFGTLSFRYDINESLSAMYRVGLDGYNQIQKYAINKGGGQVADGLLWTSERTNFIQDHNLNLSFNKNFSETFNFNAVAGVNLRRDTRESVRSESSQQFVYDLLVHNNFINHTNTSSTREENLIGAYFSGTAGYRDMVYLNLQARNDWTSTLEKANRSVFYPSASVSFIPTEMFSGLTDSFVDYLKIRVGYGTSAGYPSPYSTRNVLGLNTREFITRDGTVVNTNSVSDFFGNPDLKPEIHKELEIGLEGRFFNNRLTVDLSLYDKNSEDLIIDLDLDPSTGYESTTINAAEINNRGIELGMTVTAIQTEDFTLSLNGNFTHNEGTVEKLAPGIDQIAIQPIFTTLGSYAIPGEPYGVIQGERVARDDNGNMIVNSSGLYNLDSDIGILGDTNPNYMLNGGINLGYKGLNFNALIAYVDGGSIYSTLPSTLMGRGILQETDFDRFVPVIAPGVNEDGTPNDIIITSTDHYWQNGGVFIDEMRVYDGSYVIASIIDLVHPNKRDSEADFKQL